MRSLGVTSQTNAPLNSTNSVKLMTIHKSKGLEFAAVALPVLGSRVTRFNSKVIAHKDLGIALNNVRSSDETKPSFYIAADAYVTEMEREEQKRLLYVAMTRARDYLSMFTEVGGTDSDSFRRWIHKSLLVNPDQELSPEPTTIGAGELKCAARLFDAGGITQWLQSLQVEYPQASDQANRIDFSLMEPFQPELGEVYATSIPWQASERVTPLSTDGPVHQTVLGEFFHAIVERFAAQLSKPPASALAALSMSPRINALLGAQRDFLIVEGQKLMDIFFTSELFEIMSNARRRLHEAPYTVQLDDESFADRRVDLIIEDADGKWLIIDYKTDLLSTDEIESKTNEHSDQVLEYVRHFEQLTGYKASGWLYFARLGQLHAVKSRSFAVDRQGQLKLPLMN